MNMGFLSEIFDDALDIASAPIKAAATVTDYALYPFEDKWADTVRPAVDSLRESVRINK